MRPNATADELLKQLPGFQIDREGKISVNGQAVQKILVDGEEFFSDDPTLVSQIIRADMIDKVQLFNKKSDQASFAGINDGKTSKTVNLKLKENKKKGSFGKVGLGGGKYYYGNALYNRFNGSEKLSAYVLCSNSGDGGITWQDKGDYEASSDMEYATPLQTLDDWNGQLSANGFPNVQAGGVHYNNKWDEDKESVRGELRAGKLNTTEKIQSNILYLLPGQRLSLSSAETDKHTLSHQKLGTEYKFKIDSLTELSANIAENRTAKHSQKIFNSSTLNEKGELINDLDLNTQTSEKSNAFFGEVLIARRSKGSGRLLTFNFAATINNLYADGTFVSTNRVWDVSQSDTSSDIDLNQFKQIRSHQHKFSTDLMYRQPLSKGSSLVFRYAAGYAGVTSMLSTFDQQPQGGDGPLDSIYSNNYVVGSNSQKVGLHYLLKINHFQFDAGNDFGFISLDQSNNFELTRLKRAFTTWLPAFVIRYNAHNGSITSSLTYNGNTNLPAVQQMQPLTNNSDPNNIIVGNPLLRPSFSNVLKYSYINSNFLTRKTIWVDISYNVVSGDFSSSDKVDSFGRRSYQWYNSDYSSTFYGIGNFSFPLTKTTGMGVIGSWNRHRTRNIVNGDGNLIHDANYTGGIFLSVNKADKFNASINANASYYENHSSIQPALGVGYWAADVRIQSSLFLPFKSELHTNCSINLRGKTANFSGDANSAQWDFWISKRLLKNQSVTIKAAVMDLLNQGTSIMRSLSTNYIAESRFDRIKRYFQLSAAWNFSRFPGSK